MTFAEKLKELRKQNGISQEQLAEKIYVSRQAITKWESGNGIPDIGNLISISNLFNESLDSTPGFFSLIRLKTAFLASGFSR